jgi:putative cardiolipin synthase
MATFRAWIAVVIVALVAGCASLPPQTSRTPSYALSDTDNTRLGTALRAQSEAHPGSDALHLLANPVDAMVARVFLAASAEKSLDLQYYIWHDDLTGRELAAALLRAADRGVRVRVLLDDLGTNADDRLLLALNSHPNLKIRLFNPVANRTFKRLGMGLEFSRINRRMHNKSMIADNQFAILGGRNIGDEYFGASTTVDFGDLDILIHGPTVPEVSTEFDTFWNSDSAYPIDALVGHPAEPNALAEKRAVLDEYVRSQQNNPYVVGATQRFRQLIEGSQPDFVWGRVTLLYDDPSKIERAPTDATGHLMTRFRALNLQPKHEMLIVSPYFIPGKEGVAWIRGMTERGVRVTVLTNSLAATDVAAVHAGYQRYRKELVANGVRLYELRPTTSGDTAVPKSFFGSSRASLHAKTYVFDRTSIFIGSMNLDPRSVQLNTEIGAYCESSTIAAQVVDGVEKHLGELAWRVEQREDNNGNTRLVWIETAPDGSTTELDKEPDVSAARRFGIWFLGLLPIESQL